MTETVTETTGYAIELPSGELADDLGSWDRAGGVHSVLPGGQAAYLWETPDVARSVRMQLSTDLTGYGLQTCFMQHSRVVEVHVRTTLEIRPVIEDHVADDGIADAPILDEPAPDSSFLAARVRSLISVLQEGEWRQPGGPIDVQALIGELQRMVGDDEPIMEAHVVGLTEPRTWSSVTDIPVGTRFYDYVPNNVYERRETDCLHIASGSMYRLAAFKDELNIYTEVLPETVEPRTWQTVAEIPFGVRFASVEHRDGPYSWIRFSLHSFREYIDGTESFVAGIDLDQRYGNGFVEVLS
ncbi:hypothetical protein ACFXG4_03975 [Nocardia sp. NPDC059246]|uniref:hypothetical protein n=1 Tax=unclassified Nocardia TaxID=2637762 RepID=UPI00368ABD0C